MEKATFAAGCFWEVEAEFRAVPGVVATRTGYTGGMTEHPTYEAVCSHDTGHAEAVEVTFDPAQVSYEQLLALFWRCHDPTSFNRQGPDAGPQYRSAIFCHTPEQERAAHDALRRLDESGRLRRSIVTRIEPAGVFWPAEEHHQRYHEKHGGGCGF